jgi:hypothetical protein
VADLSLDSRRIVPGALFLAVPGTREHGLRHAAAACRAGATLVAWEPADGWSRRPAGGLRGVRGAGTARATGRARRPLFRRAVAPRAGRRHHRHERQDHLHAPGRQARSTASAGAPA